MGGPGSGRLPSSIENAARLAAKRRKAEIKAAVREELALGIDYTENDPETEVVPGLRRADVKHFYADVYYVMTKYGQSVGGRESWVTIKRKRAEAAAAEAAAQAAAETADP